MNMERFPRSVRAGAFGQAGFTLLELFVAVVIAGVLFGLGVPSFSSLQHRTRLDTATDAILQHLMRARNHAITHRARVTLCARNGDSCGGRDDWSNGWIIFENRVADDSGQDIDEGDRIIGIHRANPDETTVRFHRAYVYYKHTGIGYPAGTFRICNRANEREGTRVTISFTGRPRLAQTGDEPVACDRKSQGG